jgi:hypothetical protein
LKTTTIDDLIAKLEKLSAAGFGDETVSMPVVGPRRTPIAAMLGRAEDVRAKNARQVECSISVWDALDLLEAARPGCPVYATLDGGRSVRIDGGSITRDDCGHYYALHPAAAADTSRSDAKSIAEELSGVLMHEDVENRKEIRLVVIRRSGPVSDRLLALRPDGIADPYAPGGPNAGPFMLNAVTIPAE